MLRKFIIRNFQNIKKKIIKIDKHVTIIIGPNDTGKSALVRALSFISFNRPSGRSFITHGRDQCILELFFDKFRLKRVVGKNGYYSLNGKKFKAVGTKVPDEIAAALSVEQINFQPQHSPLFWFGLTPGQISKELNKLVDLESIDKIQSEINKRLRQKKAELTVVQKRLSAAREDVTRYTPIKKLDVKLGKLEKIQANLAKSHRIDSLTGLLGGCVVHQSAIESATVAGAVASDAVALGMVAIGTANQCDNLTESLNGLERAERLIDLVNPVLPIIPDHTKIDRLSQLLTSLDHKTEGLRVTDDKFNKLKEKLEKKLGGRCPYCGGILTDKSPI